MNDGIDMSHVRVGFVDNAPHIKEWIEKKMELWIKQTSGLEVEIQISLNKDNCGDGPK